MVVDSKQKTMTALNYEKDDTIIEITNNKKIDNYHDIIINRIYFWKSKKLSRLKKNEKKTYVSKNKLCKLISNYL